MTTQEAYEQMREYFSQPGAVIALDEDSGTCCYRTEDGAKCAAGCLIPDELYSNTLEGTGIRTLTDETYAAGVDSLAKFAPTLAAHFEGMDLRFLQEAQHLHDHSEDADEFIEKLDALADGWGLKVVTS